MQPSKATRTPRWQLNSRQARLIRTLYKKSSIGVLCSPDDYRCIDTSHFVRKKVEKAIKKYIIGEYLTML
eukprot:5615718-Karenia_brevis.AAC.1